MKRTALLLVALLVASVPSWGAAGDLNILGKFNADGAEFDLATYRGHGETVALVGIAATKRNSLAFSVAEWPSFVALWRQARKTQAPTWHLVGTFKETDTEERTLLTVSAGKGVQFVLTGEKSTLTFLLPPSDFAAFDAKVKAAAADLAH
jgi:hypothetical protein